jgi:hypothetical protein
MCRYRQEGGGSWGQRLTGQLAYVITFVMTPEKGKVFQFRLSLRELGMLKEIAAREVKSAGDVLRGLIRQRHELRGHPVGSVPPFLGHENGQVALRIVSAFAKRHRLAAGLEFFSPRQWMLKGHDDFEYCGLQLVVFHQDSDLRFVLNEGWGDAKRLAALNAELDAEGLIVQNYGSDSVSAVIELTEIMRERRKRAARNRSKGKR